MKISAITCTHGRPEAFNLCNRYVDRQTRQVDQWIPVHGPAPMGLKLLTALDNVMGDVVIIIEDDDWYSPKWVAWCEEKLQKYDIVGQGLAFYYHVKHRWYSECANVRHASLCNTAFSSSLIPVIKNVIQSEDNQFFDTRIWRLEKSKYLHLPNPGERMVVGIKGMPGTRGYSGEHVKFHPDGSITDPSMLRLWQEIGADGENYLPFYERT